MTRLAGAIDGVIGVDPHRDTLAAAAAAHRANSDALDAVRAAREALNHDHPLAPRRRGEGEALRVLLATRHSACVAKVSATNQFKALSVGRAGGAAGRASQGW